MSIIRRAAMIFKVPVRGRQEETGQHLNYFYQSQIEALTQARRMIADHATNLRGITLQLSTLEEKQERLKNSKNEATEAGRTDLASEFAAQLDIIEKSLLEMRKRYDHAIDQDKQMTQHEAALQSQIQSFSVHMKEWKSEYSLAEQTEVPHH